MIPELLLEQILLGEKKEKDYYDKYGKDEIQDALAKLRASDQKILSEYPAEKVREDLIRKSVEKHNNVTKTFVPYRVIKYCAAAVLLFVFAGPLLVMNYKNAGKGSLSERVKGNAIHHQLKLYKQVNGEPFLLKNGDIAGENDLIQITYIPGQYKYGVIFSVDGKGGITRHFPEESWKSDELEKTGSEVPLSFSYSLDDAPDYECFIFAASKTPFDLSQIEKINKDKVNIEFLKKASYLPENCDAAIFVLKKNQK